MISVIEDNMEEIGEICRRHGVARLEVFGSAADGTFDPARSDIDFLVEFLPGFDLGPWMAHYLDLQEELRELFGREVDLVELKAVRNPFRRHAILSCRKAVYAA